MEYAPMWLTYLFLLLLCRAFLMVYFLRRDPRWSTALLILLLGFLGICIWLTKEHPGYLNRQPAWQKGALGLGVLATLSITIFLAMYIHLEERYREPYRMAASFIEEAEKDREQSRYLLSKEEWEKHREESRFRYLDSPPERDQAAWESFKDKIQSREEGSLQGLRPHIRFNIISGWDARSKQLVLSLKTGQDERREHVLLFMEKLSGEWRVVGIRL